MTQSINPTTLDVQKIVEIVRRHLVNRNPGGATLDVVAEGVRHDQDWWYVPVRPSIQPAKRYEYYETLAEIENELGKQEDLTILLIPAIAE